MRVLILAALVALVPAALAQPRGSAPGVEELVQSLTPPTRTRSLNAGGSASAVRNLVPIVDLVVNFDFDSARLRDTNKETLLNLAAAMNDPRLAIFRFRVEGHTDARGSVSYNDQLSLRRAYAVVKFLESRGVSAERLDAQGKGFNELLDANDPDSAVNRRVRVVTLP